MRKFAIVLSILQNPTTLTFYLHDAVYLYLRTVNQTLTDGYVDYRDGRLIRNRTIGQRFVGEFLMTRDDMKRYVRRVERELKSYL